MCYKSEGRWFDPRWCHWNFLLTKSFRPHYSPGVDSASNRNEYQEYLLGGKCCRCVRLTTLPPFCAVIMKFGSLNLLEHSGPPHACNGTALPFFYGWWMSRLRIFRVEGSCNPSSDPTIVDFRMILNIKVLISIKYDITYHLPVPLSWNLGTITSWNPLGHSRPITGLLYPFF